MVSECARIAATTASKAPAFPTLVLYALLLSTRVNSAPNARTCTFATCVVRAHRRNQILDGARPARLHFIPWVAGGATVVFSATHARCCTFSLPLCPRIATTTAWTAPAFPALNLLSALALVELCKAPHADCCTPWFCGCMRITATIGSIDKTNVSCLHLAFHIAASQVTHCLTPPPHSAITSLRA
jgi:hypothetical protein